MSLLYIADPADQIEGWTGGTGDFADNETVAGSDNTWTLAHTLVVGCVPQLFVPLAGAGMIALLKDSAEAYGYTIDPLTQVITTVTAFGEGVM
jgi:hypothetical protein